MTAIRNATGLSALRAQDVCWTLDFGLIQGSGLERIVAISSLRPASELLLKPL
jgi:hypothetical protein